MCLQSVKLFELTVLMFKTLIKNENNIDEYYHLSSQIMMGELKETMYMYMYQKLNCDPRKN